MDHGGAGGSGGGMDHGGSSGGGSHGAMSCSETELVRPKLSFSQSKASSILNNTAAKDLGTLDSDSAWTAAGLHNEFWEWDLQAILPVVGVVTQPKTDCCNESVAQYRVATSTDGHYWKYVSNGNIYPANIRGNVGRSDPAFEVVNNFPWVQARYVRIEPVSWIGQHISMRSGVVICNSTAMPPQPPLNPPMSMLMEIGDVDASAFGVSLIKDVKGAGWVVSVSVDSNFTWDPSNASKRHFEGHGHAHVYLDGVKLSRLYCGLYFLPASKVAMPMHSKVRIVFYNNLHKEYVHNGVSLSREIYVRDAIAVPAIPTPLAPTGQFPSAKPTSSPTVVTGAPTSKATAPPTSVPSITPTRKAPSDNEVAISAAGAHPSGVLSVLFACVLLHIDMPILTVVT